MTCATRRSRGDDGDGDDGGAGADGDGDDVRGWATPRRYSEFKALAATLARTCGAPPPLPSSRHSLESVLSRVGYPDTRYLERRRAALDRWLHTVVSLPALQYDADARAAVINFVDPTGQLHRLLARPSRTQRLRALEDMLSAKAPPDSPPSPPPPHVDLSVEAPGTSSESTLSSDRDSDTEEIFRPPTPPSKSKAPPPGMRE